MLIGIFIFLGICFVISVCRYARNKFERNWAIQELKGKIVNQECTVSLIKARIKEVKSKSFDIDANNTVRTLLQWELKELEELYHNQSLYLSELILLKQTL